MTPKDKILTYEQARELKWFCKNVAGTRLEFYAALDGIRKFQNKIDRLYDEAISIRSYFAAQGIDFSDDEPAKPTREGGE